MSAHYSMLGDGFLHGHTHLRMEPDPGLLALSDPYDPVQNAPYTTDLSFYNGKFYMCYGPVPALLTMPTTWAGVGWVRDWHLVIAFLSGSLFFSTLLIRALWRRLFANVPEWTAALGILAVGLAAPVTCALVGLDWAMFHEAATTGGLFFMTGALYWTFTGLGGDRPVPWRLALAGTFLALAEGSRVSLAVAILGLAVLVAWRICRSPRAGTPIRARALALASFSVPLFLGAIALGTYNYVRFGSWREFGALYQLTGATQRVDVTKNPDVLISSSYILPDLYSLLLRPPVLLPTFPYLRSTDEPQFPSFIAPRGVKYFGSYQTTGILLVTPFVWLAALPPLALMLRRSRSRTARDRANDNPEELHTPLKWTVGCLLAVALGSLLPNLFVSASAMRYGVDFTPPLIILAMLGVWMGWDLLAARPQTRSLWLAYAGSLAVLSALFGVLLGTCYYDYFQTWNPELTGALAAALPEGKSLLIIVVALINCTALCLPLALFRLEKHHWYGAR